MAQLLHFGRGEQVNLGTQSKRFNFLPHSTVKWKTFRKCLTFKLVPCLTSFCICLEFRSQMEEDSNSIHKLTMTGETYF